MNVFERLSESNSVVRLIEPGTVLARPGSACEVLAFIEAGQARVFQVNPDGREINLYRILPGECCLLTASCILGNRPFPVCAVAESPIRAHMLGAGEFQRLVDTDPWWRRYVFSMLGLRLGEVFARMESLLGERIDARLARVLIERTPSEGDAVLRATHAELAVELGTSREVVSRALKRFERRGWLELSRGVVRLKNRAGLRAEIDPVR